MIAAKIIADSMSPDGVRITTMQLVYQRFIHGELLTHRRLSRNAMSSRAIPVRKMIEQVRNAPAMPIHWGANQKGMQANAQLEGGTLDLARLLWLKAAENAADIAEAMEVVGLHKQVANRVLEPFQWMHTIVTATEWGNLYALRRHKDAQPEFQRLADCMFEAQENSIPDELDYDEWHLPYITEDELAELQWGIEGSAYPKLIMMSAARAARVSYLTHEGKTPTVMEDLALFERLAGGVPIHASPLEHQAKPALDPQASSGNFNGWTQFRQTYNIKETA